MTREERAIRNLKQMCSDGRYLGSGSYVPLEVLEDFNLAIKTLEQQEPILDKIRDKIEQLPTSVCSEIYRMSINADEFKENVLAIIDEYKAESEE